MSRFIVMIQTHLVTALFEDSREIPKISGSINTLFWERVQKTFQLKFKFIGRTHQLQLGFILLIAVFKDQTMVVMVFQKAIAVDEHKYCNNWHCVTGMKTFI